MTRQSLYAGVALCCMAIFGTASAFADGISCDICENRLAPGTVDPGGPVEGRAAVVDCIDAVFYDLELPPEARAADLGFDGAGVWGPAGEEIEGAISMDDKLLAMSRRMFGDIAADKLSIRVDDGFQEWLICRALFENADHAQECAEGARQCL